MNFKSFNLHPLVEAGVKAAGYDTPTSIQEQSIPLILKGEDILGLAQTGTGKTAAYALPMLHRLMSGRGKHVRALIIAPTRELVEQIHSDITKLGWQDRTAQRHDLRWSRHHPPGRSPEAGRPDRGGLPRTSFRPPESRHHRPFPG